MQPAVTTPPSGPEICYGDVDADKNVPDLDGMLQDGNSRQVVLCGGLAIVSLAVVDRAAELTHPPRAMAVRMPALEPAAEGPLAQTG